MLTGLTPGPGSPQLDLKHAPEDKMAVGLGYKLPVSPASPGPGNRTDRKKLPWQPVRRKEIEANYYFAIINLLALTEFHTNVYVVHFKHRRIQVH